MSNRQPAIIAHGGAGDWSKADPVAVLEGMETALAAGWDILQVGGSALDAVEQVTVLLEDHPLFDAGFGSFLNQQGEVELDALIADGTSLNFGAVAGVKRVKNPITLARRVLTDTDNCFFVADGAEQVAVTTGIPLIANLELITDRERASFLRRQQRANAESGLGTVGCVALDVTGNVAAATSTGGVPNKRPGRVGDSPVFGAGGYADNAAGAASATGRGENILRTLLSKVVIDFVAAGATAPHAAEQALQLVESRIDTPNVGVIVVDALGNVAAAHTTPFMPVATIGSDGQIWSTMQTKRA